MSFDDSPGSATRREEAREKAKSIREQHRKQEKKNRLIVVGTILLFVFALVGAGFVVFQQDRPAGPGPLNMRSDGIVIGEGFEVVETAATQNGQQPVPTVVDPESDLIDIRVYTDYFCSICAVFEETNREQISNWVDTGVATLEIHPVALLDRQSQGTKYSTRAANAAACVANYSPNQYYAFHTALFTAQPAESTPGLSDEELIAIAKKAKVTSVTRITECITDQRFKTWVTEAKDRALAGTDVEAVTAPPTILVNGLKYTGPANDAQAFRKFLLQAAGASFNESAMPVPSSSPTPSAPAAE